jgi:hypothetical protein
MNAPTTTTIRGVSIFSRQPKRKADVFDISLSPEGIVIQRPGRNDQHMAWERVSAWEIEERPGCVVLTLRGGGSVTPLMVEGWTLEDLETVMRDVTEGTAGPDMATAVGPSVQPDEAADPDVKPDEAPVPEQPRPARRQAGRWLRGQVWRPLVTVVLLGVLAAAVVLVLLQSAGVISWSFLGPVA